MSEKKKRDATHALQDEASSSLSSSSSSSSSSSAHRDKRARGSQSDVAKSESETDTSVSGEDEKKALSSLLSELISRPDADATQRINAHVTGSPTCSPQTYVAMLTYKYAPKPPKALAVTDMSCHRDLFDDALGRLRAANKAIAKVTLVVEDLSPAAVVVAQPVAEGLASATKIVAEHLSAKQVADEDDPTCAAAMDRLYGELIDDTKSASAFSKIMRRINKSDHRARTEASLFRSVSCVLSCASRLADDV